MSLNDALSVPEAEPREQDIDDGIPDGYPTDPEIKCRYWAKLAGAALREAHDYRMKLDATVGTTKLLLEMQGQKLAQAEHRLAELRADALLAVDAIKKGDVFSGSLLAQGLLAKLTAPEGES